MLLGSCVVVVVIMLIVTATTGCQYYTQHYQAYCNWYQWARWCIIWCFTTLVCGLTYTLQGFLGLVRIKFINYYMDDEHTESMWVGSKSPSQYAFAMASFLITAPTVLSFIILGMAFRRMEITATLERTKKGRRGRWSLTKGSPARSRQTVFVPDYGIHDKVEAFEHVPEQPTDHRATPTPSENGEPGSPAEAAAELHLARAREEKERREMEEPNDEGFTARAVRRLTTNLSNIMSGGEEAKKDPKDLIC